MEKRVVNISLGDDIQASVTIHCYADTSDYVAKDLAMSKLKKAIARNTNSLTGLSGSLGLISQFNLKGAE